MIRLPRPLFIPLGVCLMFAGCRGDAPVLPCPPSGLGFVEGVVTAGGEPVQTVVELVTPSSIKYPSPDVAAYCETDSAGWYSIEVPLGKYFLIAGGVFYGMEGPGLGDPDTLRVAEERTRIDVALGSLTLDLQADPLLNGRELGFSCRAAYGTRFQRGVVSDGRVQVRFSPVPPGRYSVSWRLGSGSTGPWLPGTWNRDEAAVFEISTGSVVVQAGPIPPPWVLEGRITGSWQQLRLDPPSVNAYAAESLQVLSTSADADGSYRLEVPIGEPVCIQIDSGGMKRWAGGFDFDSAIPYRGNPGETVSGPSYVEGAIECRLEAEAFPGRSSGTLALYDEARKQVTPDYFYPARDNPVPIPNLEPGVYYLHYSPQYPQGLLSQWYDQAADSASATPIEVLPGGTVKRITLRIQAREAGR
jgi:hypothetical protein